MLQTMVLPISWMSPATVPATALPRRLAAFLARVERGLQHGDGGLHGLGALDQLGEEELALAEEVADLFDALHEALVEDVAGLQTRVETLLGEALSVLDLTVDDALLHLLVQLFRHLDPPCTLSAVRPQERVWVPPRAPRYDRERGASTK